MAKSTSTTQQQAVLQKIYRDLIVGNHILHYHDVLDAFGHISVRHPFKPDVFLMSKDAAPGTVSSPADLVEYSVEDARPVDPNASRGYVERPIHSECYKRFPGVQSIAGMTTGLCCHVHRQP